MYIAETDSTNTYLRQHPDVKAVRAGFQTAGRGQLGNSWESARDLNLLCSFRLPVVMRAEDAFQINRTVAVALYETVKDLVTKTNNNPSLLTIKWPNDLYWEDKKLAGTLIENTLSGGAVTQSIVGIGLNLNQTVFYSDAPNPVSLRQITGQTYDPEQVMQSLALRLAAPDEVTMADYNQHLYRRTGEHWWRECPTSDNASPATFQASIARITPQGELVLLTTNGQEHTYHFKQIQYILNPQ